MMYANYTIERAYNDLGPRMTRIGLVGKNEVTILDNLYRVSQLLHGRILASTTIPGGFRVYIPRNDLRELLLAYQTLSPYRLSTELDPLIATIRALIHVNTTDVEIPIDSRLILQMIANHNSIAINLKDVWDGAIGLRLLSCSGSNGDITIDGQQQILERMLSKFSDSEMQLIRPAIEKSGQLAGIRTIRQVEMRDMISDLLFSRKDSFVTLHQLFHTMTEQRSILRNFRTDILFCPTNRFSELDRGKMIRTLVDIENDNDETDKMMKITPSGFARAEFVVRNNYESVVTVLVAGSLGSGKFIIYPLQEVHLSGTSLTISKDFFHHVSIDCWADIRGFAGTYPSIVSLATNGQLADNNGMTNIFFQIIKPVVKHLPSFVQKVNTSELIRLMLSRMPAWVSNAFNTLTPGSVYSGWLLTDAASMNERILYIYMLTIMLPEMLLDPTFTFSNSSGTPPYVNEYGNFVENLRKLYD